MCFAGLFAGLAKLCQVFQVQGTLSDDFRPSLAGADDVVLGDETALLVVAVPVYEAAWAAGDRLALRAVGARGAGGDTGTHACCTLKELRTLLVEEAGVVQGHTSIFHAHFVLVGAASFVHAVELETRAGVLVESVGGGVHAHQAVAILTPVSAAGRHVRWITDSIDAALHHLVFAFIVVLAAIHWETVT